MINNYSSVVCEKVVGGIDCFIQKNTPVPVNECQQYKQTSTSHLTLMQLCVLVHVLSLPYSAETLQTN